VESFVNQNTIKIQEFVPSVFDVVTDATVTTSGNTKILTWNKNLNGDKTYIEYSYSVPLEFPKLYALGPIEIEYGIPVQTFEEARPWFVAVDPQVARPSSDVTLGSWMTELGVKTDIYLSIDEASATSIDFIETGNKKPPPSDFYETLLASVTDPQSSSDHIVNYRIGKDGTIGTTIDMEVQLRQGGTLIASKTHLNIGTFFDDSFLLTGTEADSITDYSDLRLRFIPTSDNNFPGRSAQVAFAEFEVPTGDTTPPTMDSAQITSTTTIDVTYSENLDAGTVATSDYTVASNTISGVSEERVVIWVLGSLIIIERFASHTGLP